MTSADYDIVIDDRRIAVLSLNRTPLNIIGSGYADELARCIRRCADMPGIRVLVIASGNDRAFIGGADVNEMAGLDPRSARDFIGRLADLCEAVRDFPAPTIARINAWCLGVGMEFAAACDIRVATADACFAMPEVRIGIPSVIQAALLSHLIGESRTRLLLLTGKTIDAWQAKEWGFLTEVCAQEDMDAAVASLTSAILECDPYALRMQKSLLRDWQPKELDLSIRRSVDVFGSSYETAIPVKRMSAFLQRKKQAIPSQDE
jgi:enoyl-CoA hydratase/carnithine racemase